MIYYFICLGDTWTPHRVELALWTHYITNDLKPELLEDTLGSRQNSNGSTTSQKKPEEPIKNGNNDSGEDSNIVAEDSNLSNMGAEDSSK